MNGAKLRVRVLRSIDEIAATTWDACANPDMSRPSAEATLQDLPRDVRHCSAGQDSLHEEKYNPFISHNFLHALEASGSVGAKAGWQVQHLAAQREDGQLIGAVPCYLKSHSRGEYVFDHGWAEAYERAGGNYYPKLQVSVPFTPASGRRLLVRPGPRSQDVRGALADGLAEICRRAGVSGVHVTFATEPEFRLF